MNTTAKSFPHYVPFVQNILLSIHLASRKIAGTRASGRWCWIFALGLAAGPCSAQAQFKLVDHFQQATPGDLDGQNGWTATPSLVQVTDDPTEATNKVVNFSMGEASAYLPLSIPQGATATLFFRAYAPEDTSGLDWFAGMSDNAISGTGVFGDFEVQLGVAGSQSFNMLKVRDGSAGGNVDSEEFLPQTWYKLWVVIDNAADRSEVFMQGSALTNQTQVDRDSDGGTNYVFRNSGTAPVSNPLIRFFALCSTSHVLPMLLDDIYLATGRNLLDPTITVKAPLSLEISSQGGVVTLRWEGNATLQSSDQVGTGYTDVAGAQSPYPVNPTANSHRFYRLRR